MKKNRTAHMTCAAALAAGFLSAMTLPSAFGISDQSGGTTVSKLAATPPTPPSPPPITPPPANKISDEEFLDEINNPLTPPKAPDPGKALQDMIRRMTESQKRLTQKDASTVTQESQKQIVTDLDGVIAYVREQMQKPHPKPKPEPKPEKADQKKESKEGQGQGKGKGKKPGKAGDNSGNNSAQDSSLSAGDVKDPAGTTPIQNKSGDTWGNLPPKDRDLITNGVQEKYLPAYQTMIDDYYKALAEVGKTKEKP
jgi:hypothetical protein